jgi:hypothetical protein
MLYIYNLPCEKLQFIPHKAHSCFTMALVYNGINYSAHFMMLYARNFFRGGVRGVQQIQLRTEGRENGDLGAVAS